MNHTEFIKHFPRIREQCQAYLGKEHYWFQALSTSPSSLTLPHTYPISVRECQYGRGVFADVDIPKDTVITLYPAHHHAIRQEGATHQMNCTQGLPPPNYSYRLAITPALSILGCPTQTDNQWFLGHMINDACDCTQYKRNRETAWLGHYRLVSKTHINVAYIIKEDYAYILTTQDIKAGQQLLVSYGPSYWFNHMGTDDWEDRVRRYIRKLPSSTRGFFYSLLLENAL